MVGDQSVLSTQSFAEWVDQDPQPPPHVNHLQACDQTPQQVHVDRGQDELSHPPQMARQGGDEEGGERGGDAGVADHLHYHREDHHIIEPRRRGLRPRKIVRYKL